MSAESKPRTDWRAVGYLTGIVVLVLITGIASELHGEPAFFAIILAFVAYYYGKHVSFG